MKNLLPFIIAIIFSCSVQANISDNYAILLIDADDGYVMMEHNADRIRYPASLTKLMTLYIVFEELTKGTIKEHSIVVVSNNASSQVPSKMDLNTGEALTVKELIMGLIVKSANDGAVAIAEFISGNEKKFAKLMNKKAKSLGMHNTIFQNASGLHDDNHVTTSYDMAKLALAIMRDFPKYYPLFSNTSFVYKSRIYTSRNHINATYDWVSGLKTGFTMAAGYNMITTASKDGKNMIGIVMGEISHKDRDIRMLHILNKGFTMSGIYSDVAPIKIRPRRLKPQPAKNIYNY